MGSGGVADLWLDCLYSKLALEAARPSTCVLWGYVSPGVEVGLALLQEASRWTSQSACGMDAASDSHHGEVGGSHSRCLDGRRSAGRGTRNEGRSLWKF